MGMHLGLSWTAHWSRRHGVGQVLGCMWPIGCRLNMPGYFINTSLPMHSLIRQPYALLLSKYECNIHVVVALMCITSIFCQYEVSFFFNNVL